MKSKSTIHIGQLEDKKMNNEGENLAKVLTYYGLLNTFSDKKIICPFHEDVNPSMLIDLEEGRWFCFGCQLSGNARKFVQLMEAKYNNLNDLQSYQKYLKILKDDKVSNIKLRRYQKVRDKPQRQLYLIAYDYYYGLSKVLWTSHKIIEGEIIKARDYMKSRGFEPSTLNKAGAKITYNDSYELIFPMLDNGKFKGWVCRTMDPNLAKKRKYLYNEGFRRATTLVGNYGSKDYVIVVEGYMDRLKFVQYGEENVVAILGWKMSIEQEKKLKQKGIKKIISALDNDECGRKGTKYLRKIFGEQNVIRWSYLKGIKDPGDMTYYSFNKMFNKTMKKFKEVNN